MKTKLSLPIKLRFILGTLAPGIVAGTSNFDVTAVGICLLAGSFYGYGLLWIIILSTILGILIQQVITELAAITKSSLLQVVVKKYGLGALSILSFSILASNISLIAAQLGGMAIALGTAINTPIAITIPLSAAAIGLLFIGGAMRGICRLLSYVSLVTLVYIVSAFSTSPPALDVVRGMIPSIVNFGSGYMLTALAIMGATLTPYTFIYQTEAVAREEEALEHISLNITGASIGMLINGALSLSVIIASASTLFTLKIKVDDFSEAAFILSKVLGNLSSAAFFIGLFSCSFLSLAVILHSNSSILERILELRGPLKNSKQGILLTISTLIIGSIILLSGIKMMKIVFIACILAQVLTPIPLIFTSLLCSDREIGEELAESIYIKLCCWLTTTLIIIFNLIGFIEILN